MSWLKIDENLPDHPKVLKLAERTKLDPDLVVGRLFRLWRWCLRFSESGNLTGNKAELACNHIKLKKSDLVRCGFIDRKPYIRIHDWWNHAGYYLVSKYKKTPEKWERIKEQYSNSNYTGEVTGKVLDREVQKESSYGRKDVATDKHQDARETSPSGSLALNTQKTPVIKTYEEAGDNELCGPPKDLLKLIAKKVPPATTD